MRKRYLIEQKLMGLVLLLITVVGALVEKDCTIGLILVPLGIYLILTKDNVIHNSDDD